MEGLLAAGAAGFTDDGIPLMDGAFVRAAMEEAARLDTVLSFHEEDKAFIKENGINHGRYRTSWESMVPRRWQRTPWLPGTV